MLLSRGRFLLTRLFISHYIQPVSSSSWLWSDDDNKLSRLFSQRPSKKGRSMQAGKLSELLRQLNDDEVKKDEPVEADNRSGGNVLYLT